MRIHDPMKITLSDIAVKVGVSKSLVSMYLNNHRLAANIAEETKRRIDLAVAETGYKPSFTARALASGKTRMLGMVAGGLDNVYFAGLANAALDEAATRGYQMQLSLTRWNRKEEKNCLNSLLERHPEGIIYCPRLLPGSEQYRFIRDTNYPMLILETEDPAISNIGSCVEAAFRDAIGALKARGHRKVTAYLFAETGENPHEPWPTAFLAACRSHNVEPDLRPLAHSDDRIVEDIIRERIPALIFHEQKSIPQLLIRLAGHPDYTPDIIAGYCAFDKFIRHERMLGGIYSESEQIIRHAVQILIQWAENGKPQQPLRQRFPATYQPAGQIPAKLTLTYALLSS